MKTLLGWLSLCVLLIASPVVNENGENKTVLATVLKVDGKAKLLPKESIKKRKVNASDTLYGGDKLISYADTTVVVELSEGSRVILNENAELLFADATHLDHKQGEIYYKINKRHSSKGLNVKTPFSIIGIKGTEFIVGSGETKEIALNEGRIGVQALHAKFELHKKKELEAYEEYKNKQQKAFDAYKMKSKEEIVEHVKSFDLEAGNTLRFTPMDDCSADPTQDFGDDDFFADGDELSKEIQELQCGSKVDLDEFSDETSQRFDLYKDMLEE